MTNTAKIAKFNMIEQQIRPWEVLDRRILSVIDQVDRVDFVPENYRGLAYADCQVPVNASTSMFPPTIEGRLLQALLITKDDNILEIGTGSGYITACLATLGKQVLSLDISAENLNQAKQKTDDQGLTNISYESTNAFEYEADQQFDVIAVTGSVSQLPQNLQQALAIGGRMFVIVGQSPAMQALLVTRISSEEWRTQSLFETDLPALSRQ